MGLEDRAEGQDEEHADEDVDRAHELPVGGGDLLEAGGVFCVEAAAKESAVDGEDSGGGREMDGSEDDVGGGYEEDEERDHFAGVKESIPQRLKPLS